MGSNKLDGQRRDLIVALVVDAVIFQIPLTDGDIGLERSAGKTMKMQTVNAASANARSTSPYSNTPFQTRLVPASSCNRLLSSSAVSASTTGSSGAYSICRSSAASSATAGDSATTAATGSPWYRTLETAKG